LKIQTGEEEHTLEHPVNEAPALVAAPRHLRRRAFHEEIPDTLLVPDVQPYTLTLTRAEPSPARRTKPSPDKRTARDLDSRESAYRRKRLVALLVVIAVSLSIPILIIALVFVR
jgi:hypothetical protein